MSAVGIRVARPPGRGLSWALAAALLGAGLGVASGVDQLAVAVGVLLLPALVVLLLRPDLLPAALVVTVFGEAILVGNLTISRLAGPLALVIMVLSLPGRHAPPLPRRGVLVAVAAYAVWALASSLWTVNPDSSLHQGGSGYALASLALSISYMLAITMFVRTEEHVRRLVLVVWAVSVIMGAIAIAEYSGGYNRAVGLSGDANFFAALQVVALPIGAVLASQTRSNARRLIVLLGLAVIVGSIVTSLSRGGLLALAAVFLLLALQPARGFFRTRARKRAFLLMALVGAALLLAASFSALSARTSSLFSTADATGSGRINLWRAAVAGWHEHPVVGLGYGAFIGQSNDLLRQTPGVDFSAYQLRDTGQFVHNAYLESLTELGVVGLVLFFGVLATMARTLWVTARAAAERDAVYLSAFTRAVLLSLAGFALASVFLSTETDRVLWVMLGLSLALPRVVAAHSAQASAA